MGFAEALAVVRPLLHLMLPVVIHVTGTVIAFPAITDIAVAALCPSKGESCPDAIYASGLSQTAAGFGTMLLTPIIGSLSDDHGRKPLILLCFAGSVLPYAILAWSKSRQAVITYYIVRSIIGMLSEGTFITLVLAYVADVIAQEHRAAAFGVTMSSLSMGLIFGPIISRSIPTAYVFQVATAACLISALYMAAMLPETLVKHVVVPGRALETGKKVPGGTAQGPLLLRNKSQLQATVATVRTSPMLFRLAIVGFLSNFAESGIQAALFFYLKLRFGYEKDQYALLMSILGVASLASQLLLLPLFVHFVGVRGTLLIGLFFSILHGAFYGAAWASWVPYLAATMAAFTFFIFPSIGAMVSAMGSQEQQGKLQGVVSGLRSLASALAPLFFNPLLAYTVSEDSPVKYAGFGILIATFFGVLAFCVGVMLPPLPPPQAKVGAGDSKGYVAVQSGEEEIEQATLVNPALYLPSGEEYVLA